MNTLFAGLAGVLSILTCVTILSLHDATLYQLVLWPATKTAVKLAHPAVRGSGHSIYVCTASHRLLGVDVCLL